ncbi:DNA repair helicase [Trichodelitschia bisporula]|uniref:ATP-dependent DNA helicase CHL1 n=1 Tax=Trichodelitschia bisporula TaxID=703511 RepID=A0A6G1I2U6_9PEZI|nr:DNA repair helicase [Trichodelitschia bisporula]
MEDKDFHHPYTPYPIQRQLMAALYECIEEGKVGIFESPTGKGKSLSLICGSLTWLREHKRKMFDDSLQGKDQDDEPDWMLEYERKEKRRKALQNRRDLEGRLARIREKEKKVRLRYERGEPEGKRRRTAKDDDAGPAGEDQFVLDEYESDEETRSRKPADAADYLSAETLALMKKLNMPLGGPAAEEDDDVDELKVFYCSRTHSQLSQFANELRRVKLPPAIEPEPGEPELSEELKHLTLGSRKNLCINPKVNRLGSAVAINERCIELQKPGLAADKKCPHLPTKDNEALVHDFKDHALAKIRDIEDLGELGKKISICPYYASRSTIKPCEIVTLPYPLLLQKSAREALGLSLKNHIIIIDEAHNLMDAIVGIHSVSVSLQQLTRGRMQLMVYAAKFRNRLKGKNRVYVTQAIRLIDSLLKYLQKEAARDKPEPESIVNVADLMAGNGVDQINLYKLARYLQESKLARKVDGYTDFAENDAAQTKAKPVPTKDTPEPTVPVLTHIQSFLLALMNPSAEGRFFTALTEEKDILLKYMLLDPTHHFHDVVSDARAVILAGGTMSPMSDFKSHLFPYLPPERISTLSCGHVIPPRNLFAWPVTEDATRAPFALTFESRGAPATIARIGATLLALLREVPDGVVVFFPSYGYLDTCVKAWRRTAGGSPLWDQLVAVKPAFVDPGKASPGAPSLDALLSAYGSAIASGRGAVLLSVMSGSLSEGINFADALGRAVVVIGMPYPNPHTAEWKAKSAYIAQKTDAMRKDTGTGPNGKEAAREFYENATMRAVNQAIGRAIRHRNDYAAILLLDQRYGTERVRNCNAVASTHTYNRIPTISLPRDSSFIRQEGWSKSSTRT